MFLLNAQLSTDLSGVIQVTFGAGLPEKLHVNTTGKPYSCSWNKVDVSSRTALQCRRQRESTSGCPDEQIIEDEAAIDDRFSSQWANQKYAYNSYFI